MAKRETVRIGGREVPIVVAALIAEEADRLGLLPSQVGDVVFPEPAPTQVHLRTALEHRHRRSPR